MRVLVVDQDSASNLAITRSLRELYTVDCVTNKGDCLDLLRSNTFEVIVATERLEDGSGLELLGTVSKKWPSVLRIFAADRQRLQLLRGRLGPFNIFQTLSYPIEAEKLIAALELAAAADQQAEESEETPAEEPVAQTPESDVSQDLEQSDEFSEPRFARAGRAGSMQVPSLGGGRSSARGASNGQARSGVGQTRSGTGQSRSAGSPSRPGASQSRSGVGHSQSAASHSQSGVGRLPSGAGHLQSGAGHSRSGVEPRSAAGESRSSVPPLRSRSAPAQSAPGVGGSGGARGPRARG